MLTWRSCAPRCPGKSDEHDPQAALPVAGERCSTPKKMNRATTCPPATPAVAVAGSRRTPRGWPAEPVSIQRKARTRLNAKRRLIPRYNARAAISHDRAGEQVQRSEQPLRMILTNGLPAISGHAPAISALR